MYRLILAWHPCSEGSVRGEGVRVVVGQVDWRAAEQGHCRQYMPVGMRKEYMI